MVCVGRKENNHMVICLKVIVNYKRICNPRILHAVQIAEAYGLTFNLPISSDLFLKLICATLKIRINESNRRLSFAGLASIPNVHLSANFYNGDFSANGEDNSFCVSHMKFIRQNDAFLIIYGSTFAISYK
ncbi:hypothetical protein EGR_09424 [Echinococcus granulosus]|uniref:Uncharacterized protein n=1 Tax=Echinococcus granulosus TaxID=6210 RepID=W6U579_ECHGR|nr:hypothetical protein EGR_09424 [Echinococcus granulosus]EUB55711.1 hypothetical protein EGR_09424 [Echinococcus granulosus]